MTRILLWFYWSIFLAVAIAMLPLVVAVSLVFDDDR